MASAQPGKFLSAEERRRQRELEEARKAGLAPAEVSGGGRPAAGVGWMNYGAVAGCSCGCGTEQPEELCCAACGRVQAAAALVCPLFSSHRVAAPHPWLVASLALGQRSW